MGADVGRLLDLAFELGAAADLDEFRAIVTSSIGGLVGCDLASYTEIYLETHRALALCDQPVPDVDRIVLELGRLSHQHPLITRRVGAAQTISDYLSARGFSALELYSTVYRPLGARDQLAINLASGPRLVIGIAFNRPRASFSPADRETLDRARSILSRGYHRARAREHGRAFAERLSQADAQPRAAVIACSADGSLEYASDYAITLLRTYLGPTDPCQKLQQQLGAWLDRLREPNRSVLDAVSGERGVLQITPTQILPGEPILLELREHRDHSPADALTVRERQILARAGAGDTNRQIANVLGLSHYTVQNHLQSIYRKLDVTNRTAAAARLKAPVPWLD
jgi:DNA-binding CsgD family transcriptional regulator